MKAGRGSIDTGVTGAVSGHVIFSGDRRHRCIPETRHPMMVVLLPCRILDSIELADLGGDQFAADRIDAAHADGPHDFACLAAILGNAIVLRYPAMA